MGLRAFVAKHVSLSVIGLLCILLLAYEIITTFVAYTWDAYVATDVLVLSPIVAGQLVAIPVVNNETVKQGDLLFEVDPRPYSIEVTKGEAAVTLAQANYKAALSQIDVASSSLAAAQARQADAKATQARIATLVRDTFMSQQELDNANRDLHEANAAVSSAEAALEVAKSTAQVREASIGVAQAQLGTAQYNLSHTKVFAPTDGTVAPYQKKPGDYVQPGDDVLAVVTNNNWRVVANLKEQYLETIKTDSVVYIRLAGDPWRIHRGTVRSIARGVSRSDAAILALPYVAVDTQWVRLQRRFPVEIDLGLLPEQRHLYAGSDASVLLFVGLPR
ncbi:multidrug resistance efflux pump [Rhodoligotrophos appendicifer]|uniref:HlyD family secretion protein n=1 Tax=Rhodoligotrophos appendicifer TaxID=987056 RepID=UPI0011812D68|nr:HlyD family efflux transporter periplasmic adaptor subunit [Rhodoligotrophos appendicifer]